MDQLRTGEKIAGASGIALLLIMFIFSWFGVEGGDEGRNAWEAFSIIDIVIFLAAAAGIALAVISATQTRVDLPVAMSALTAGLGVLAVILILFRILSTPDLEVGGLSASDFDVDVTRSIGVFLGLIAAGGVAYGGWQAMQDEGTSFSDQADRMQGGGNEPPPPPPPPPPASPPAGGPPAGGPAA